MHIFVKPILTIAKLKTLRKLSRSKRGVRVSQTAEFLTPVLVPGVSNPLVDPIIREGKAQSALSVTDRADIILFCQKTLYILHINPLTAGVAYSPFFFFFST